MQLPAESPTAVTGTAFAGTGAIKLMLVEKIIAAAKYKKTFETFSPLVNNFTAVF